MAKDKIAKAFLAITKDKFTIDTIAEMIATKHLAEGDIVRLNGYYSAGDGANHIRIISKTNDRSGILLANGLYANIVNDGEVNVSWFGAKGDGVTDDTMAIQKAKNLGIKLIIPKGIFILSSTLDLGNTSIDIEGVDKTHSILKILGDKDLIKSEVGFFIRNITLSGDNEDLTKTGTSKIINLNAPVFGGSFRAENIRVIYARNDGIYARNFGYSSIKESYIQVFGGNGLTLWGDSGNSATTTWEIGGYTQIGTGNGYGIKFNNVAMINILGVTNEATKGIEISGDSNRAINLIGYYAEKNHIDTDTNEELFIKFNGWGQGLNIIGCFGGGAKLKYSQNFLGVNVFNSQLLELDSEGKHYYNWAILQSPTSNKTIFQKLETSQGAILEDVSGAEGTIYTKTYSNTGKLHSFYNKNTLVGFIDYFGGFNSVNNWYGEPPIKIGNYRIWCNSQGVLFGKNGIPANENDGNRLENITTLNSLDTPYHASNMSKLGILDSYHNYLSELHEFEKSQNVPEGVMNLNVVQPPVIPKEIEEYAKEYNLL
ncbi:MAG: hypothetical protein RSD13_02800 [Clostridium sp.]